MATQPFSAVFGVIPAASRALLGGVTQIAALSAASAAASKPYTVVTRTFRRRPLNLPADLLPQQVNGKWHMPKVSARQAADLRKAAIVSGGYKAGASAPGT